MDAADREAMFDRLAAALPAGRVGVGGGGRGGDLAPAHERLRHGRGDPRRRRSQARSPLMTTATRLESPDAFLVRAGPFLAAHEAEHNLALGLLGRLRGEPRLYGFDPAFVIAEDAGSVVGCLLRTPPHGVVLSRFASLDGRGRRGRGGARHASRPAGGGRPERGGGAVRGHVVGADGGRGARRRPPAGPRRVDGARRCRRRRAPCGRRAGGRAETMLDWLGAFAAEALGEHPRRRGRRGDLPAHATPTPTARGSSGTTAAPSRSPPTATRRRRAPASAPSTRRPSTAAAATRPRSSPS